MSVIVIEMDIPRALLSVNATRIVDTCERRLFAHLEINTYPLGSIADASDEDDDANEEQAATHAEADVSFRVIWRLLRVRGRADSFRRFHGNKRARGGTFRRAVERFFRARVASTKDEI